MDGDLIYVEPVVAVTGPERGGGTMDGARNETKNDQIFTVWKECSIYTIYYVEQILILFT